MFLDLRWLESGTTVLTLNTPVVFSAHICTQAASSQCCTVRQSQTLSDREGVLWFSIRIPSEISRREQITHRTYNRITDTRFGKSKSMPCSFVKQIVLLSTSTVFLDYGYKIWFITLCSSFTALTPARRAQENLGHGGITVAGCGCQMLPMKRRMTGDKSIVWPKIHVALLLLWLRCHDCWPTKRHTVTHIIHVQSCKVFKEWTKRWTWTKLRYGDLITCNKTLLWIHQFYPGGNLLLVLVASHLMCVSNSGLYCGISHIQSLIRRWRSTVLEQTLFALKLKGTSRRRNLRSKFKHCCAVLSVEC